MFRILKCFQSNAHFTHKNVLHALPRKGSRTLVDTRQGEDPTCQTAIFLTKWGGESVRYTMQVWACAKFISRVSIADLHLQEESRPSSGQANPRPSSPSPPPPYPRQKLITYKPGIIERILAYLLSLNTDTPKMTRTA